MGTGVEVDTVSIEGELFSQNENIGDLITFIQQRLTELKITYLIQPEHEPEPEPEPIPE